MDEPWDKASMTREQKPYAERTTKAQRRLYRKRRMQRAKAMHRELIRQLCRDRYESDRYGTDETHCAICLHLFPASKLEVDHERGRRWKAKMTALRYDARIDRYWAEYKRGVKLRPACKPCNRTDGAHRRAERRLHATDDKQ